MSKNLQSKYTALSLAMVACLSSPATETLAQTKSKLGTNGVEILASDQNGGGGKLIVVKRNGRDFASYSAPAGLQSVLLCCSFGSCSPIRPNTALFCDIVVNCTGWACHPE